MSLSDPVSLHNAAQLPASLISASNGDIPLSASSVRSCLCLMNSLIYSQSISQTDYGRIDKSFLAFIIYMRL